MINNNTFSYILIPLEADLLLQRLKSDGFSSMQPPPYAMWKQQRNAVSIIYYTSGKCVIQGKEARSFIDTIFAELFLDKIEPETEFPIPLPKENQSQNNISLPIDFHPHAGIDESGKGDFFGPLVVACAYVNENTAPKLLAAGLKDCKLLSDSQVLNLAQKAMAILTQRHFSIITMGNETYNRLYSQFKNLNHLLAWGHARTLENILEKEPACTVALGDQFANPAVVKRALMEKGRAITLHQRTKAESDIAVATASVLARAAFLKSLETLSETLHMKIPKGASSPVINAAKILYKRDGEAVFNMCAKTHFKTLKDVCGK